VANALGLVVLVIVGLVVYLLLVGGLLAVVGHVSRGGRRAALRRNHDRHA
jgi:hypothetical protein